MRLNQVIAIRDQMNKQALLKQIDVSDEALRTIINRAFEEGAKAWEEQLVGLFGAENAYGFLAHV